MKRAVFFIVAVVAGVLQPRQACAQQSEVSPCGIWQLSIPASRGDASKAGFIPVWKIYYPDGQFAVMTWSSDKESSSLTVHGTYTLEGDSVIVENEAGLKPDVNPGGRQNRIRTTYIGSDCMVAQHYTNSPGGKWEELWKRVTVGGNKVSLPVFKNASDDNEAVRDLNGVYFHVERMPQYVGGDERALTRHIESLVSYPDDALDKGLEGVSAVRYVINEEGRTENFQVVHSSYKVLDDEAVRVLKTLRFIPGMHNGRKVKVYCVTPVRFQLK